jgi:hypothetical protein
MRRVLLMRIVAGERGEGKSHYVAQWWLQDPENRGVLCSDGQRATILRMQILDLLDPEARKDPGFLRILTHNVVGEVVHPNVGRPRDFRWVVDDFESVLYRALGFVPTFVTGPDPEIERLPSIAERVTEINEQIREHQAEIRRLGTLRFDIVNGRTK